MRKERSPEAFVRAWLESSCIADVAKRTGYAHNTVSIVAMRLRRLGVRLPHMRRMRRSQTDVAALNRIIEESNDAG
jgi:hypothetical protein